MTPGKKKMGLFMATVLVLVNMVGTGIFLLPVSMASVGSISIFGWIVAAVGAAAIGLMFSILGSVKPQAGGPYAYARDALGPYLGFQTNYIYWSANLIGNIAVATTVTGYLLELIPGLQGMLHQTLTTIAIIWIATAVNIAGPRWVGFLTGWGTVLAMFPLVLIAVAGWFWFSPEIFLASWNPHAETPWNAISTSAAFALWAFMGVESASVASGVIENPKRNIPLATMIGLALLKICQGQGRALWHHYLLVAIVGIVSIYCLWVVAGSQANLARSAMIILFASVPLYPFFENRINRQNSN